MVSQLDDALATATLSEPERRTVRRLVSALREDLGSDLLAVWLYGSRSRGEADPSETDPDRRSDIDLMVIVDPAVDSRRPDWDVIELVEGAAGAEGDSPVYYSVQVWDRERLLDRRRIDSFFVQEVDRDKIVLAGSALDDDAGTELA
jgi:predicted nucleotidyltransferase